MCFNVRDNTLPRILSFLLWDYDYHNWLTIELEKPNVGSSRSAKSSSSMSFRELVLSELILCFFLLLSCLVISSSYFFVSRVGMNWYTSAGVSDILSKSVSTFERAMLWRVVIGLINLSHPIDDSRWVSHLFHLINIHESRRSTMIFSSPYSNWFRVSTESILC